MNRANVELRRRARVYAALGDPVRLAIVDRLYVSDAAPRELSEHFGLATNLLAHHLQVLEVTGVIRRSRSEGDRRRKYVQLRLDNPAVRALGGGHHLGAGPRRCLPSRVVFVCTHNSARSQLAAAAWGSVSVVPAASAGTHPAVRVHPRAVAIGHRHDLSLEQARTSSIHDVVRRGDLVVAVCDRAHEELADPESAERGGRIHWSVPDPVLVNTNAAFEGAYRDIAGRVDLLADVLASRDRSAASDPPAHPS